MTPTAEQGFEEWWAVYGKQPPKMNEDHVDWVRDAYLTAYRAGLLTESNAAAFVEALREEATK